MLDLVGNPEDRFSHNKAQLTSSIMQQKGQDLKALLTLYIPARSLHWWQNVICIVKLFSLLLNVDRLEGLTSI